jgi:hypothetical protein
LAEFLQRFCNIQRAGQRAIWGTGEAHFRGVEGIEQQKGEAAASGPPRPNLIVSGE